MAIVLMAAAHHFDGQPNCFVNDAEVLAIHAAVGYRAHDKRTMLATAGKRLCCVFETAFDFSDRRQGPAQP